MLPFKLHPEADAEGIEAVAYIKAEDPREAAMLKSALRESLDWACRHPLIFRCFEGDFRKVKVGKFHFSLVFRVHGDEVQVLAIAHMSRLPGYWKKRATKWPESC